MFTSSILHHIRCCSTSRFTLGHCNGCCPRESNFLCVTDFPQGEAKLTRGIAMDKSWENKWITYDSSRGKNRRWFNQSRETEKVKCTKQQKSSVVYALCSAWGQILRETGLKFPKHSRILSAAVNVFTFNIFKSILKHSQVFFTSVFQISFLMKSLEPFL